MLLAYSDDGPGRVVVLLHGYPLSRAMWAEQIPDLGAIYRIIAPDLLGHGESPAPDRVYTMDAMADDEERNGLVFFQPRRARRGTAREDYDPRRGLGVG